MSLYRCFVPLAAFAVVCAAAPAVHAQGYANAQVRAFQRTNSASQFSSDRLRRQIAARDIGRFGVGGVNATNYASNRRKKPFQGLNRGPAVSPYLALSGSFNGVSDYYNVVKPQQEFERARRQQELEAQRNQRAIVSNEHRLNQMAAQAPFSITGDQTTAPTGHSVTYQNFGNFGSTGNYFAPMQGLDKQFR